MNHDDIQGLIVLLVAPGSCLMNVVKSTSMWSQCSRPSTIHKVASAQTPPYLWRRSTLMTSLFACMLILSQDFFSMKLKTSVKLMALCRSSTLVVNFGLAALWDQRHVFCILGAFLNPWPHSAQIWRGT